MSDLIIKPLRVQLDPGLLDWRFYRISWNNDAIFAEIIATNTANGSYAARKEYWLVNRANLTAQSGLTVASLGDKAWTDSLPTPPTQSQEIVCNADATWQAVDDDLTTGTLYKHSTLGYYVRIVITGTAPSATITTLRWYQEAESRPGSTFDPSGSYTSVSSLGRNATWFADSKSP